MNFWYKGRAMRFVPFASPRLAALSVRFARQAVPL